MYSQTELSAIVNRQLETLQTNNNVENLYAPIHYVIANGGKRIRPVLILMAYNLYREDIERIMDNAIAMEVFHNFTLLHDDVMDKASVRRGKPCVHVKWNENTAILSGDAMFALAYKLMTENKYLCGEASYDIDEYRSLHKAILTFNEATVGVCEGQQFDMDFENEDNVNESQYMDMIRLKTSLLLSCSLKIGAQLAGAVDTDAQMLYDFGEKVGLAFQLQDDLLDVYGDPKVFGKNIGGDIVSNKKTFMLIKALELADEKNKTALRNWISKTDFKPEEKIKEVIRIYNMCGIKELCEKKIEELFCQGMDSLEQLNVEEDKKIPLREFAFQLMNRKY